MPGCGRDDRRQKLSRPSVRRCAPRPSKWTSTTTAASSKASSWPATMKVKCWAPWGSRTCSNFMSSCGRIRRAASF
ncbi:hypothetical protein EJ071_26135 [Mesorhizobium sp. M1B.F.Ca.ET.045.04.1.1]|nr:hypothetical protein EJ071_26135 [Mesorhizobium sp. M1B.F.Ca.ET.045.04.1.1]